MNAVIFEVLTAGNIKPTVPLEATPCILLLATPTPLQLPRCCWNGPFRAQVRALLHSIHHKKITGAVTTINA
jgi:hypothetical protein